MSLDLTELEREVRDARARATKAEAALEAAIAQEAAARREPLKALARRAHDCLCQWNHTDGCPWGYEDGNPDPWTGWAHHRWLAHYDRLVNGSSHEKPRAALAEVEQLIAAVETLRPKVPNALFLLRSALSPT